MRIHLLIATVVAAALLAATSSARAQTWTGAASNDWFTSGNWSTTIPTTSSITVINTVGPSPPAPVIAALGATSSQVQVGNNGTGMLTIESSGTLTNTSTSTLGINGTGSQGTVIVNGGVWNSGTLNVGQGAGNSGTLTIENGGTVSAVGVTLGTASGTNVNGSGPMLVTGPGSSFTTGSQALNVGGAGVGRLTIENGGTVTSAVSSVGSASTSAAVTTSQGTAATSSTSAMR